MKYLSWALVGILTIALLALLFGGAGEDVPPGQTASARCSGLIVSNSCNVHMEQAQPEKPERLTLSNALGLFGLVVIGGAVAFAVGAAVTSDSFERALGGQS